MPAPRGPKKNNAGTVNTVKKTRDDELMPPVVVGAKNWITPAYELEEFFFPQADWIIDAVHEKILPLSGHVARNNFTPGEMVRAYKKGV